MHILYTLCGQGNLHSHEKVARHPRVSVWLKILITLGSVSLKWNRSEASAAINYRRIEILGTVGGELREPRTGTPQYFATLYCNVDDNKISQIIDIPLCVSIYFQLPQYLADQYHVHIT